MDRKRLDPLLYPEEIACKTLEEQLQVEEMVNAYFELFKHQNITQDM
jgi:hypothetical protein